MVTIKFSLTSPSLIFVNEETYNNSDTTFLLYSLAGLSRDSYLTRCF